MIRSAWRRTWASLGAVVFLAIALIQLNDPDPLYWFAVYAAVAGVMLAAAAGRLAPQFALVVLGAVVAGVLMAAPGFLDYLRSGDWASLGARMQDDRPYIESAREFLGLLIAALALVPFLKRP